MKHIQPTEKEQAQIIKVVNGLLETLEHNKIKGDIAYSAATIISARLGIHGFSEEGVPATDEDLLELYQRTVTDARIEWAAKGKESGQA